VLLLGGLPSVAIGEAIGSSAGFVVGLLIFVSWIFVEVMVTNRIINVRISKSQLAMMTGCTGAQFVSLDQVIRHSDSKPVRTTYVFTFANGTYAATFSKANDGVLVRTDK
jgi:hypothetical protein